MTPRDFCYWLQGYFQFNDASKLDGSQAQVIAGCLEKTEMRAPASREATPKTHDFCQRLSGVFDIVEKGRGLTAAQVAKIKDQLAETFRDELDSASSDDDFSRTGSHGLGRRFGGDRDGKEDALLC